MRVAALLQHDRGVRPSTTAIVLVVFLGSVFVVGGRTLHGLVVPGRPAGDAFGLVDFRDAVYYPVVAFLDGQNPYDPVAYASAYPVGNVFPFYSPLTLLVHLPFGLLPFAPSAAAYFLVTVALLVWLAHVTLRMSGYSSSIAMRFALASALVISQPGQWDLFLGQCAAPIAVATYGALYLARRRPWAAGLCFAVASIKPTTGVPLALLMLVRGDRTAVLLGTAAAVVGGATMLAPIVYGAGGVGAFVTSVRGNYAGFTADPNAAAATSPYRLDVAALLSRPLGWSIGFGVELALMAGILAVGALALFRVARRDEDDARVLSTSIVCVTVLVCVYHQSYEAILVAFPLLMAGRRCLAGDHGASPLHWALFVALVTPAVNYLVMGGLVARMPTGGLPWLAATSLDGVALLVAFGVLCTFAWRGVAPYGTRAGLSAP
jgi:hypothetical protein